MIAEHLQLLAYLWSDISVVGIKSRKVRLESIDVSQGEFGAPDPLDAPHNLDQPAARGKALVAQEQRLAPGFEHRFLRNENAVAHQRDLARLRYGIEADVR